MLQYIHHCRSANSTSVQCIAGSRRTTCAGPVVFTIDNAVVRSLTNFTYTDDPQVYALVNHNIIRRYIENVCYDAGKCTIPVIAHNRQSYVTRSENTSASYLS